jgi:D-glycero-D-manno-heptose 1,7-bisphosphate phosphatase
MNRVVFLDRDGVLVRASVRNGNPYAPRSVSKLEILPDAQPATRALKAAGLRLVVASNQADGGHSLVSRAAVEGMHHQLLHKPPLDAIKICYDRHDEGCGCSNLCPGMLQGAIRDLGSDAAESFMVGDRRSDVVVGRRVGCYRVWVNWCHWERRSERADAAVLSLAEAAEVICGVTRSVEDRSGYGRATVAEHEDLR